MHDPKTVAFEIRRPWKDAPCKFFPNGYRPTMVTIWHHDPERDGSDDSCGWSYPKLSDAQRKRLKALAWNEGRNRYYMRWRSKACPALRSEAEALYRGLILQVAAYLHVPMTYEQAAKKAAERVHEPDCVDAAGAFCFLPGYHTNGHTDTDSEREDHFLGTICGIARGILADRRPWYRHPRWHFWHWELQVHALQQFKRWAFSHCAGCGKRFTWGYSPISHQWDSDGPRWFRGERGVYHSGCDGSSMARSAPPKEGSRS